MKGFTEMVYGYISKYTGKWVIHGEKRKRAGSDGMAEIISLHSIYTYA